MTDIELYDHPEDYETFQLKRIDYKEAINSSIKLSQKYLKDKINIILADFCCGTGDNTQKIAKLIGPLKKAILIDINKGFLEKANKLHINSKEKLFINKDVLQADLKKEADLVISIFAYHHIKDNKKIDYINKIKDVLKKQGILILTEIYLHDKKITKDYYDKLFNEIPINKRIKGLKEFLQQTAESTDFEFKVNKSYSDKQFQESGFSRLYEEKIWPKNNSFSKDIGTFVQVYRLN